MCPFRGTGFVVLLRAQTGHRSPQRGTAPSATRSAGTTGVTTMGAYYAYQAYEASRVKTGVERREADAQLGRLAEATARFIHRLTFPRGSILTSGR